MEIRELISKLEVMAGHHGDQLDVKVARRDGEVTDISDTQFSLHVGCPIIHLAPFDDEDEEGVRG